MSRGKTHKEFEEEVYKLVGNEYTAIGQYKNNRTKIKIKHEVCDKTYMVRPDHFTSDGRRCPYCSSHYYGRTRKTQKEFEREVKKKSNGEYEVLGGYENTKTKIELKHKKCGHIWKVRPKDFLSGSRCPKCAGRITQEAFGDEIEELTDGKFTVVGQYTGERDEVEFRCNKCGTVFKAEPKYFKNRLNKCPNCERQGKSQKKFIEEVKEKGNNEYKVLGEFKGTNNKITFKHKPCGTTFTVDGGYFLYQGKRCPKCTKRTRSKGEKKVKKFLDDHNIKYKRDYSFKGCKHDGRLRYDFALFTDSDYGDLFRDKITYLIEYNGKQHYKSIAYFGGQERLEHQEEHDKIKEKYAEDSGILLLVIKYTEKDNIEDMLTSELL